MLPEEISVVERTCGTLKGPRTNDRMKLLRDTNTPMENQEALLCAGDSSITTPASGPTCLLSSPAYQADSQSRYFLHVSARKADSHHSLKLSTTQHHRLYPFVPELLRIIDHDSSRHHVFFTTTTGQVSQFRRFLRSESSKVIRRSVGD